jgi:ABC transport system ATP-binding/permease protein
VFGFAGARVWTPVGDLSGGERRRLQMLRLLAAEPNVLLLDEPTNDLDIDTLAALEDLLDGWPGSLVVASHDRYFVERVADTVYAMFGDGQLVHLPGGVDEYLARLNATDAGKGASDAGRATRAAVDTRAAQKELVRLERLIARLDQREAGLHEQLAAHATDYQKITLLQAELSAVQSEKADAEHTWLTLAEQV